MLKRRVVGSFYAEAINRNNRTLVINMTLEYIEKSTGLSRQEIEEISLCDWVKKVADDTSESYKVKQPRFILSRGSVYAFHQRYVSEAEVNDYINRI